MHRSADIAVGNIIDPQFYTQSYSLQPSTFTRQATLLQQIKMGVKGLKWYMRNHYLDVPGFVYQPVMGPLIIDGCGIMYDLYEACKLDWRIGGRYAIFKKKVTEFFRTLVDSGIRPVVVMDGLDLDAMKFKTLCQRKKDNIRIIRQGLVQWTDKIDTPVSPLFMIEVFLEAVREAGVTK